MLANSADRYGLGSRFLHWAMALLILAMIGAGAYMSDLAREDPLRAQLYSMHKAVGVTVLALVGLQVAGALKHRYIDKDPGADVLKRML